MMIGQVQCLSELRQAAETDSDLSLSFSQQNNVEFHAERWTVWRVCMLCEQCHISTNNAQQMLGRSQARCLQSPVYSLGISVLTLQLETLLTLRNPAFQGISDESSILLTWQT